MPEETQSFELQIEVAGTPEQVWAAVATGPGISAWLQPTDVEERAGGTFTYDMGDEPRDGTVTGWEPPRRFAQETRWPPPASELAPVTAAAEWIVEAVSGETCVVRLVMSGFGTGPKWDADLDGLRSGMRAGLENLRRYLAGEHVETDLPLAPDR